MINLSSGIPSVSLIIVLLFVISVIYYFTRGREKGINSMKAEIEEEE